MSIESNGILIFKSNKNRLKTEINSNYKYRCNSLCENCGCIQSLYISPLHYGLSNNLLRAAITSLFLRLYIMGLNMGFTTV